MERFISINEHSSIRIEKEKIIYIDPFRIKKELHDADLILVTHSHFDHYSKEDIEKVMNKNTILVFPKSMQNEVSCYDEKRVILFDVYEKKTIIGIEVETVPSYNVNKPMHPKENGWVGYILKMEGSRIYVLGDTDINEDVLMQTCDIALVPIGGTYTTNAVEAATLVNNLKPSIAIPTHYGTLVGDKNMVDDFIQNVDKNIKIIHKINFEKV